MLNLVLYIIGSYLLGAIPFSVVIGYAFAGVDVRKHGSGNAGATNVYRVAGLPAAIIAGLLDVAKGAAPVFACRLFFPDEEWLWLLSGLAAVIGHILPVFAGFKGGKGVNTLLGVFVVLLPFEVGISGVIFGVVFALTRIISVSSLCAGMALPITVLIQKYLLGKKISLLLLSACVIVAVLLLFTHRANIRRLVEGTEQKITG